MRVMQRMVRVGGRPAAAHVVVDALVVVVDGHGQHLLGVFLPDDVLVQVFEDLFGWGRRFSGEEGCK